MQNLELVLEGSVVSVEKLDSDSTVILMYPDFGDYAIGCVRLTGADAAELHKWLGEALK
ncbi:hypothetical protein VP409E501_P0039 [Vibrio phage 409E50-1]|nr:hypothetical protein VP521E561_P0039 [Vibrio phage 521E56-1]CAH9012455.1 hypothetical protein VP384E501_P0039 [Vibrio phage 384E50-1]CAH9012501.1 hypothetical protein VP409E501_P0039 [Vibrio phage 409E50-1]CAH9012513.1 hypothetical protein VP402E501_P0039 [Vibrio phage 402E50-1]CAH9013491.1 hypothetical protein VP405E501_P0039 [Vibrio phage 405E50-1]CAH9013555.1 hypothetical protein VP413E501_P0039 [Vibrio phage 413E50-1]